MSIEAIVVGALGSWDPKNERICHRPCSKKYTKLMNKLIVSDTLRASRDIYITHINRKNPQFQPPRYRQFFTRIADSSSDSDVPPAASAGPSSLVVTPPPSVSAPPAVIVAPSSEPASDQAVTFAIELATPVAHGTPNTCPEDDSGAADIDARNSRKPESGSSSPDIRYPTCAQRGNSRKPESHTIPLGPDRPTSGSNLNPSTPANEHDVISRDSSAVLPEQRSDNSVSSTIKHLVGNLVRDSRALLPEQHPLSPSPDT